MKKKANEHIFDQNFTIVLNERMNEYKYIFDFFGGNI